MKGRGLTVVEVIRKKCKLLITLLIVWSWLTFLVLVENTHGIDLMERQRVGLIGF